MMRRVLLIVVLVGCTKPYVIPGFEDSYRPRAKVVAVAPLANTTTVDEAPSLLWQAIYSELRGWQEDFTVTIQPEKDTKQRLADAGLTEASAAHEPTARLCSVLGADAVLRGTVTSFMTYDAWEQMQQVMGFGTATGSQLNVDLLIRDCSDTALVWSWKVKQSGGFRSSPAELRERVGSKVAAKFPYRP